MLTHQRSLADACIGDDRRLQNSPQECCYYLVAKKTDIAKAKVSVINAFQSSGINHKYKMVSEKLLQLLFPKLPDGCDCRQM